MAFTTLRSLTIEAGLFGAAADDQTDVPREVGKTVKVALKKQQGFNGQVWLRDGDQDVLIQTGSVQDNTTDSGDVVFRLIPSEYIAGTYYEVTIEGAESSDIIKFTMPDADLILGPGSVPNAPNPPDDVVTRWTALSDTPNTITPDGWVRGNEDGTGLVFGDDPGGGDGAARSREATINLLTGDSGGDIRFTRVGQGDESDLRGTVRPGVIPEAANAAPADAGTASVGTSARYARQDHVHAKPTITDGDIPAGIARDSELPQPANATPVNTSTAAVGTSTRYARQDHDHGFTGGSSNGDGGPALSDDTPQPLGTASAGTGDEAARDDHVHPAQTIPAVPSPADDVSPVAAGSGTVGSSTEYAREDHAHPAQSVPSPANAAPVAPGTASVGTSGRFARQDHRHPPQSIPASSSGGPDQGAVQGTIHAFQEVAALTANSAERISGLTVPAGQAVALVMVATPDSGNSDPYTLSHAYHDPDTPRNELTNIELMAGTDRVDDATETTRLVWAVRNTGDTDQAVLIQVDSSGTSGDTVGVAHFRLSLPSGGASPWANIAEVIDALDGDTGGEIDFTRSGDDLRGTVRQRVIGEGHLVTSLLAKTNRIPPQVTDAEDGYVLTGVGSTGLGVWEPVGSIGDLEPVEITTGSGIVSVGTLGQNYSGADPLPATPVPLSAIPADQDVVSDIDTTANTVTIAPGSYRIIGHLSEISTHASNANVRSIPSINLTGMLPTGARVDQDSTTYFRGANTNNPATTFDVHVDLYLPEATTGLGFELTLSDSLAAQSNGGWRANIDGVVLWPRGVNGVAAGSGGGQSGEGGDGGVGGVRQWVSNTAYERFVQVWHNAQVWIAIQDVPAGQGAPGTSATVGFWDVVGPEQDEAFELGDVHLAFHDHTPVLYGGNVGPYDWDALEIRNQELRVGDVVLAQIDSNDPDADVVLTDGATDLTDVVAIEHGFATLTVHTARAADSIWHLTLRGSLATQVRFSPAGLWVCRGTSAPALDALMAGAVMQVSPDPFPPEYDSSHIYAVGEHLHHDNVIYKVTRPVLNVPPPNVTYYEVVFENNAVEWAQAGNTDLVPVDKLPDVPLDKLPALVTGGGDGMTIRYAGASLATPFPLARAVGQGGPTDSGTAGAMSKAQATKLAGIPGSAEPNVQADWGESNTASDAYIRNKPTILTPPGRTATYPVTLTTPARLRYQWHRTTIPKTAWATGDEIAFEWSGYTYSRTPLLWARADITPTYVVPEDRFTDPAQPHPARSIPSGDFRTDGTVAYYSVAVHPNHDEDTMGLQFDDVLVGIDQHDNLALGVKPPEFARPGQSPNVAVASAVTMYVRPWW